MSQIMMLPVEKLSITATNARRDHLADKAMIASLKSQGLLYPLLVAPIEGGGYDVVDGARRLSCILEGMDKGELDPMVFANVPCIVGNGDARKLGLEQSLHANLHMAMHPLDECEAILRLSRETEDDKAAIALRFGEDERWLDQRVKLASLAGEVKDMFRAGDISLADAMDFTIGTPEQQLAFLKKNKRDGFSHHMIRPAMLDQKISAKNVNFEWTLFPPDKVMKDLFSEDVFLTDRKLVQEMQDEWAQDEITDLKAQGYDDVVLLAADDWRTLEKHVRVTGRITASARAKLKCFLKATPNGLIQVHKDMAAKSQVDDKGKIKPQVNKADETEIENVRPTACTELTVAQQEIVNAHAASALYAAVVEGEELLVQYIVIDRCLGSGGWTGMYGQFGMSPALRRWEKLNKDYPAEQLVNASEVESLDGIAFDGATFSYETFCKLPKKTRDHLYRLAVASMIVAPHGQTKLAPDLAELDSRDWFVPGEDFFKRFTTEQLIDYRRRSGDLEAGKTAKKKGDHLKDCIVAATSTTAFKFGLYPQEVVVPKAPRKKKPSS